MKHLFWLLAFSSLAAAQAPAPEPAAPKPQERPVLNLKLDEPVRGAPRITFGAREGTPEQRPASTLPELGGKTSPAMDKPYKGGEVGSPYPKDETQGR
jgi:hypothetical protein